MLACLNAAPELFFYDYCKITLNIPRDVLETVFDLTTFLPKI